MYKKKISLKAYLPYTGAILFFMLISWAYFFPEMVQDKTLYQHDMVTGMSVGQEAGRFAKETGERSLWTNGLFGGMPMYQIAPGGPSNYILGYLTRLTTGCLPSPANILFMLLTGAFILFIALRINVWLAILGAVAYTFSSYFFIIIEAGHIWKVLTLAYIPPTLGGIILAYRGKYWIGALLTAIYLAFQILSNHPQMTYYFAMMMIIYLVGQFIHSYRRQQLSQFFKATAVLVPAVAIAVALNVTNLYHTYDYSKYSIRGGTELTAKTEAEQKDQTDGGLERSYVTGWSYGIGETFSLLIPNVKGGRSGAMGYNEKTAKEIVSLVQNNSRIDNRMKNSLVQQIYNSNMYWGDQPSTSGPVYAGAFVVFLFVFGIFIVRGWFKWVLLISTVMSIALSWGSNFNALTDLFLNYFPYYNKLRAVSSMLVIAELCIPILAVLALKNIVEDPAVITKKIKVPELNVTFSPFYISLTIVGGLLLLFILAPTLFFSFFSWQELQMFSEAATQNPTMSSFIAQMQETMESVRISVFKGDAWRSLTIIIAGTALIHLYRKKILNFIPFIATIFTLTLVDMWTINKRYLSGDDFKPRIENVKSKQTSTAKTDIVPKTSIDNEILKDTTLDYRVYNLTVSPFNDGSTSFYHKSIGGYHGAKLRRYQDIIERYLSKISPENAGRLMVAQSPENAVQLMTPHYADVLNVLNMLNTKYLIVFGKNNAPQLLRNPAALGNVWFADEIKWVDSADDEIAALANINPVKTAVVDKRFETEELKKFMPTVTVPTTDSIDINRSSIRLVEYQPNMLLYKSNADSDKFAVFAEIYYPKGWHVSIDGQDAKIVRANYILRAMLIPAGEHTIEFRFDPESYRITENIAWSGYILLLAFAVLSIVLAVAQNKKRQNNDILIKL
jgi:hypothetical protein